MPNVVSLCVHCILSLIRMGRRRMEGEGGRRRKREGGGGSKEEGKREKGGSKGEEEGEGTSNLCVLWPGRSEGVRIRFQNEREQIGNYVCAVECFGYIYTIPLGPKSSVWAGNSTANCCHIYGIQHCIM